MKSSVKIILYLFTFLFAISLGAQRIYSMRDSSGYRAISKYNYETELIEEIVPPKYTGVSTYNIGEGRIPVKNNKNLWGFIDSSGKEIIPCRYKEVNGFRSGLSRVHDSSHTGFIDRWGREIIPLKYSYTWWRVSAGVIGVLKDKEWTLFDTTGKEISAEHYMFCHESVSEGLLGVCNGKNWGFIDKNGKTVIPFIYKKVLPFSEGLAAVKKGKKWGYIDREGKLIIPFTYKYDADEFDKGRAIVAIDWHKYGVIDKTGKEISQMKYSHIKNFENGRAIVYVAIKGKILADLFYGVIDSTGKEIIPLKYNDIRTERKGLFFVEENKKWGIFNNMGIQLAEPKYSEAPMAWTNYSTGALTISVEVNGKEGVLDGTGKEIIPAIYDKADTYFPRGFAEVKLNNKHGVINEKGKTIIPVKYDGVGATKNGYTSVMLNGKWGYADSAGREICELKYDREIRDRVFEDGVNEIVLNGKWGFIDTAGKEIIPPKYDITSYLGSRLAKAKQNGRFAIINVNGKELSAFLYSDVWSFTEQRAKVSIDNKFGFIDKNAKEVIPVQFDRVIRDFEKGRAKVQKNGRIYWINEKGEEIK